MSRTIRDFEELKRVLKSKLPEFLEKSGIKRGNGNKNMFHCFHPGHNDRTPSLHIFESYNNEKMYYCFTENKVGDIFVANSVINKVPLIGYEFMTQNVKMLCEMFDIEYEFRPLSQEEMEEMNMRSIYNLVKDIIITRLRFGCDKAGVIDQNVLQYMNDKQLDVATDSKEYALGYVPNWQDFLNELKGYQLDETYLNKIGIKQYIFNPNNLIFAIIDERGITRGFAARNCYFDPSNKVGSKYYNTENNSLFQKGSLLYNLNHAVTKKVSKHSSLYIVEGQTDAITLDRAGLKAVAIGSTKFTNDHISLLQRVGETDVVFLLDGDAPGIENTARIITEVMEGIRNFRVRIVTLPEDYDPDTFVRKFSIKELLGLPHITAFEWRLFKLQQEKDFDNHELASQMIPLIVNEQSEIQRDRMCKQISDICDIPIMTIRKEVSKIANDDKIQMEAERDAILDNLMKSIKKNPSDAQVILSGTLDSIRSIGERHNTNLWDGQEYLHELQNIKQKQEQSVHEDFIRLWRMPRFEEKFRGSTAGKLFLLGGQPSSGKTSWMINWCISALKAGQEAQYWNQRKDDININNVTIIYHTIDDARYEIVPRFLSALAFEITQEATINYMDDPNSAAVRDPKLLFEARNDAFKQLSEWARDERLVIKDTGIGNTLTTAEMMIRHLKDKHPDRHIIYICDNLYNLADFPNIDDDVRRIKEISRVLKQQILVPYKVMGFCTVEYKKGQKGSTSRLELNEMMKESKSLEYHANWIGHLINETYNNSENTDMYFWGPTIPESMRNMDNCSPIIRMIIGKNKVSKYKGELHYYFLDEHAVFLEMTRNDIVGLTESLRNKIGNYYFGKSETASMKPMAQNQYLLSKTYENEIYGENHNIAA